MLAITLSKKEVAAHVLQTTGLRSVLSRLNMWRGILALGYHRIGDASKSPFDPELFSATPEAFDKQIRFLKRWCDVIAPRDLELARRDRRGRFALITFDDGYVDNFSEALPILQAHGICATFFLATGFIDRSRVPWWDEIAWMTRACSPIVIAGEPWLARPIAIDPASPDAAILKLNQQFCRIAAARREAFLDFVGGATGRGRPGDEVAKSLWMTWDMIRQLGAAGMELGGHTDNHVLLSEMPLCEQRNELETCCRRIEQETGVRPVAISYPYGARGSFNQSTRQSLQDLGIRYAFSFYGGIARPGRFDAYDIPRIPVERYFSLPWFRTTVACPSLLG
jgi:peptidoglycan/xylan/chitin deacetylase (PgdA/CDA1 family)